MKKYFTLGIVIILGCGTSACSPAYTWGYAPAIHPKAVTAYIYAIMARENGDNEAALEYYDEALDYTRSDKVKAERDALRQTLD